LRHTREDGSEVRPGQPDCLGYHQFRLFGLVHYQACCRAGREPVRDFSGYKTEKHIVQMLIVRVTGNAVMAASDLREAGYPAAQAVEPTTVWAREI
jgi:hypothetical protein